MNIENHFCFSNSLKSVKTEKMQERCLLMTCLVAAMLMFARCFFGVEFTDEAYCVSDPLAIMHGNVPYALAASLAAGQSFVPIMFYKVYELCVPTMEGIFLYSRLCYVLFRLVILFAIFHLLKYDLVCKWRLLILLAMIPFMGSTIQNFSYNTIAAYCTLLVSVILYTTQKDNGKILYCKLVIAGIFSAISVFAHPVSAIVVIINFALLFIYNRKEKRVPCFLAYCLGGIFVILIVLIPILRLVGINKLIYGIETILFFGPDIERDSVASRLIGILKIGGPYILFFFVGLGSLILLGFLMVSKGYVKLSKGDRNLLAVEISLCTALVAAFLRNNSIYFLYIAGMLFFAANAIAILVCNTRHTLFWYIGLPNILYVAFLVLFTQTGAPRFYYCIPQLMIILFLMFQSKSKAVQGAAAILAVCFALMQGFIDYKFVYRDASLRELDTRVENGVYRGIYTTSERAQDVVELEMFLSENIDVTDSVAFRDCAPLAYLMRSENVCDVRTWDELQYSYGCNDPTSMYRYYKNAETIPDVIAYVDFGRDPCLSIEKENEAFQYNNFVGQFYDLDEAILENSTFRVTIYRNNGSFRNDFDALIQSVGD